MTKPAYIEDRIARLEGIVEGMFRLFGNSLEREHEETKRELAEIAARKISYKRKRALKKRVPVKTKRHSR